MVRPADGQTSLSPHVSEEFNKSISAVQCCAALAAVQFTVSY